MTEILISLYKERAGSIAFERDSLHHTALNLSLLSRIRLVKTEMIATEIKSHLYQFRLSERSLMRKINKVNKIS